MKKILYRSSRLILLCALVGLSHSLYSQKDTLHIYYQGLQTTILDSNDVKITAWMKSLKGRHCDVEIYAYYDNGSYKKFMAERVDNLHLVVNRKARDLITVKFMGPVKGKKSQRCTADVVYTSANSAAPVTGEKKENAASSETAVEEKKEMASNKSSEEKAEKKPKAEKPAHQKETTVKADNSAASSDKKYEYIMDSVYVNGVLKVTKRKVKKQ